MKEIKYDIEELESLVIVWKEAHSDIYDLRNKFSEALNLIHKMDIEPAGSRIKDGIDNLEQGLIYDYVDNIEEFIETMTNNNKVIVDTNEDMSQIIKGGK